MKKLKNKIALELIRYLAKSNPELCPKFEEIIFNYQNKSVFDLNFLLILNEELLRKSKAQLRQDIFVLSELNFKKNGFFVEFGATNGVHLSNTYLLEVEFGWNGILVEPAIHWHQDLEKNRKAIIDKRCVWKETGHSLIFNETDSTELSTIDTFSTDDIHAQARAHGKKYSVDTVSLMDLLEEHQAPNLIDYLSIDTEGSEYEILSNFDFNKYCFKVITCEHNFSPMAQKLDDLFLRNGYQKKYAAISQFDGWWVLNRPQ